MKTTKRLFVVAIALAITSFAEAQNYNYKLDGPNTASSTFKVNGVCEMRKHRIENALKKKQGIWSADWNEDSKTILVKYDRTKINPDKIQQLVAAVGHDTEKIEAPDNIYASLPECCHYTRKK
ncbi:MAG TPA: heavy metal-associated domain-containing protein [Chitinophagaceae bacterium]|jgi:copper chaperone CopZ